MPPTAAQLFDPTYTGPRPTASIPNGGTFSIFATRTINAPASAVYDALTDLSNWHKWNTFIPAHTVLSKPDGSDGTRLVEGMSLEMHCQMTPTMKTNGYDVVTKVGPLNTYARRRNDGDVEGGYPVTTVLWKMPNSWTGYPAFALTAERVHRIVDLGDGRCEYSSSETFGGVLAGLSNWLFGQALKDRFEDWVRDVKQYVESQQK